MLSENQIECLELLVQHHQRFVIWREPNSSLLSFIWQQKPLNAYLHLSEIENVSGFVFAPFKATKKEPIYLFTTSISTIPSVKSDILNNLCIEEDDSFVSEIESIVDESVNSKLYKNQFDLFENAIKEKKFTKMVLSFQKKEKMPSSFSILRYFVKLCALYPLAYCSLVVSPETGIWCGATPELLASFDENSLRTMALAGTEHKILSPEKQNILNWTSKNKLEQQIVTDYIVDTLKQCGLKKIVIQGPQIVEAGHLLHIQTLISSQNSLSIHPLRIVDALHPTPAVCGIPKKEVQEFILANEINSRSYYSGFLGFYSCNSAHFFVNLRCLHIRKSLINFYAGGGLLHESKGCDEYIEVINKMHTLRRLIQNENE